MNEALCNAAREWIETIDEEIATLQRRRTALIEFMDAIGCDDIPPALDPPDPGGI